jgi:hypothetical protein
MTSWMVGNDRMASAWTAADNHAEENALSWHLFMAMTPLFATSKWHTSRVGRKTPPIAQKLCRAAPAHAGFSYLRWQSAQRFSNASEAELMQ